jgi:proteasome lid subunit RPN8/RPN11
MEMSYTPEEIKQINKKPLRILPGAYQKMLMHVLRFGSLGIPKDQWRECYGMCIGKFSKDAGITVTDALASTHGSDIGVEFMEKNYVLMAEFQDQLDKVNAEIPNPADQVFIVGWYHSHPGMERFLSSVDVRNQIAYQTSAFPFGIAIVFDNTCIFQKELVSGQLDLGFRIFRLDDPTSTEVNIPFSDMPVERSLLDKPDLIELWRNEMVMIENVQKRAPIIKEYQETPSVFGDFKLPTTADLKEAGTGITSAERQEITILPLADLDQVFTRGMQLFIEKYQALPANQKKSFEGFIEQGMTPFIDKTVATLATGLSDWTRKLREDVDKRVNYGIAALDTMKAAVKGIQEDFLAYLKQNADSSREKSHELAKSADKVEALVKKTFTDYKNDLQALFKESTAAWHELVDSAGKKLGQTELAAVKAELERLGGGGGGGARAGSDAAASKPSVDNLNDVLARHVQAVNAAIQEANDVRAAKPAPPLLGDFKIPSTAEVKGLAPFVDHGDEVTADLLGMKDIAPSFKQGLKEFTQFYDGLSTDQRVDFQLINEKGIQPLSDKVISNLVKGINQWTIYLRDDVDRRINLLVATANEMQRTMKNIFGDYVEFLVTSTDPSAKIAREAAKILASVETIVISSFNNIITYVQQVMENMMGQYGGQLEQQKAALDAKELKNITKAIENLKKGMK